MANLDQFVQFKGLGRLLRTVDQLEYRSVSTYVPILRKTCQFVFNFRDEHDLSEFEAAAANFMSLKSNALAETQSYVFKYCRDILEWTDVTLNPEVRQEHDVWFHVEFPLEIYCHRRLLGNKKVYIDLHCECSWEEEHGVALTFVEGHTISRVGSIGHLTNSDAFGRDEFENVVYVSKDKVWKMF